MKNEKVKSREVEIPKGAQVEINGHSLIVSGEKGKLSRTFKVKMEKKDDKIIIEVKKGNKREKKNVSSIVAHIKNMLQGVQAYYEYKLQICPVHFPIKVAVSGDKKEVIIQNFLGEVKERKAKIFENVNVEVKGDIITILSTDKEAAGQTAANIETATKIKSRDRRIFQDGIFIIEKAGKKI
ncbi:50S ribosomal protein L6 [Candidatus Pacearchaeota archaeon]|nr:50S ribosomal protein L6 [Candidatus Pacearchaeota archaeon]